MQAIVVLAAAAVRRREPHRRPALSPARSAHRPNPEGDPRMTDLLEKPVVVLPTSETAGGCRSRCCRHPHRPVAVASVARAAPSLALLRRPGVDLRARDRRVRAADGDRAAAVRDVRPDRDGAGRPAAAAEPRALVRHRRARPRPVLPRRARLDADDRGHRRSRSASPSSAGSRSASLAGFVGGTVDAVDHARRRRVPRDPGPAARARDRHGPRLRHPAGRDRRGRRASSPASPARPAPRCCA